MLQKIKAFFRRSPGSGAQLTYVEEQVDLGQAIVEMLDRAAVLQTDVIVTIEAGEQREGMVIRGNLAAAADLRAIVAAARDAWMVQYKKELDEREKASAAKIWSRVEKELNRKPGEESEFDEDGYRRRIGRPRK